MPAFLPLPPCLFHDPLQGFPVQLHLQLRCQAGQPLPLPGKGLPELVATFTHPDQILFQGRLPHRVPAHGRGQLVKGRLFPRQDIRFGHLRCLLGPGVTGGAAQGTGPARDQATPLLLQVPDPATQFLLFPQAVDQFPAQGKLLLVPRPGAAAGIQRRLQPVAVAGLRVQGRGQLPNAGQGPAGLFQVVNPPRQGLALLLPGCQRPSLQQPVPALLETGPALLQHGDRLFRLPVDLLLPGQLLLCAGQPLCRRRFLLLQAGTGPGKLLQAGAPAPDPGKLFHQQTVAAVLLAIGYQLRQPVEAHGDPLCPGGKVRLLAATLLFPPGKGGAPPGQFPACRGKPHIQVTDPADDLLPALPLPPTLLQGLFSRPEAGGKLLPLPGQPFLLFTFPDKYGSIALLLLPQQAELHVEAVQGRGPHGPGQPLQLRPGILPAPRCLFQVEPGAVELFPQLHHPLPPGKGPGQPLQDPVQRSGPCPEPLQPAAQGCHLFRRQGLQTVEPCHKLGQAGALRAAPLMDQDGDPAVDPGAGDLFQDGRPFVGSCPEKGGKIALGQQHGTGKPVKVHAGEPLHLLLHLPDPGRKQFPGHPIGKFMPGLLELTVRPAPRPVLAPVAAKSPLPGLELHLGRALAGAAGHDLVL